MLEIPRRRRVLAVDDDWSMREVLDIVLSPEFEVSLAADGIEALAAVQRQSPDLLLLDLHMPRMTGRELLPLLERGRWTMPVVVVSALPEECPESPLVHAVCDKLVSVPTLLNVCHRVLRSKASGEAAGAGPAAAEAGVLWRLVAPSEDDPEERTSGY
jgi:CheY-like chemotaxis protein